MVGSTSRTPSGGSVVVGGPEIERLLDDEKRAVDDVVRLYSIPRVDWSTMVYPEWSALDILAHLVSWHESFARNLADLGEGRRPRPFTGTLAQVNEAGVAENRGVSRAALLRRLQAAQAVVEQYIGDPTIGMIPYRRGGRPYSRAEHLEVTVRHLQTHMWDVIARFAQHSRIGSANWSPAKSSSAVRSAPLESDYRKRSDGADAGPQ